MKMAIEIDKQIVEAKKEARSAFTSVNYSLEGFGKMLEIFTRVAPQADAVIFGIVRAERL